MQRLGVNIDHVATLRQARKGFEPDLLRAALIAKEAGAHQITVHLRQDRRHIQDADLPILKQSCDLPLNIEMTASQEMLAIANQIKPWKITLVPERAMEITTEGGLDLIRNQNEVEQFLAGLDPKITAACFLDPLPEQIQLCARLNMAEIELNTGIYAKASGKEQLKELERLRSSALLTASLGLRVAAGHGLNTQNLPDLVQIKEIEELNIGHHIVAEALFCGLKTSIQSILKLLS